MVRLLFRSFFNQIGEQHLVTLTAEDKIKAHFDKAFNSLVDRSLIFIIKGEYAFLLGNEVSKYQKEFDALQDAFINLLVDSDDKLQDYYITAINPKVDKLFELLQYLLKHLKDQSEVTFHLKYRDFNFYNTKYSELTEICEYVNLTILEVLLNDSYSYITNLIELEQRKKQFHNSHPFQHLSIFEAKFLFIRYKWLKRRKYNKKIQSEHYGSNFSEKYVFSNGDIIDLNNKVKIGDEHYQLFKIWIDKIEFHYFTDECDQNMNFEIDLEKPIGLLLKNSYELFYKIKYHKDIYKNEDFFNKTDKLLNKDKAKSTSPIFFAKNYLYFRNNRFSFLIEKYNSFNKGNEQLIDEEYKVLTELTKKHSNNNFFITFKYLKYKLRKLEHLLSLDISKIKDDYISVSQDIQKLIVECNNKFKWSLNSYNMLYQHGYNESIITIKNHKVYFPTSFLLPFSTIEYEQEIKKADESYKGLVIKFQEKQVQNIIDSFKEELKQSEKKSIETITIFTAIISFIVGGIGAFKFLETFIQAILFILIYSVSISIFVLLIFVSTKGKALLSQYKKQIISIYIFVLFLIGCLFFSYHNVIIGIGFTPQQEEIIKNRLDSLLVREKRIKESVPFKNK